MKKIKLTQDKVALVDDEDFEKLNKYKWFVHRSSGRKEYYAYRSVKIKGATKSILMHRVILGAVGDVLIDHRNHDGLNNQKENLRICTTAQNAHNSGMRKHNTSGYKGVFWNKSTRNWTAKIGVNNKRFHLGVFTNKHKAAKAYNEAAVKLHGEFAYQNALPTAVALYQKEKE